MRTPKVNMFVFGMAANDASMIIEILEKVITTTPIKVNSVEIIIFLNIYDHIYFNY